MATTIQQIESEPAEYPDAPSGLSTAGAALASAIVWDRLESWCAHRWAERPVTWVVEGPGEWVPPLTPTTISTVKVWSRAGEWETVTLTASPLGGYCLPCSGPYQFTATVGAAEVPPTVNEAYRRLAEYMAAKPGKPGATSESVTAGSISIASRRSESWLAGAMANSGAADLLRAYRHV